MMATHDHEGMEVIAAVVCMSQSTIQNMTTARILDHTMVDDNRSTSIVRQAPEGVITPPDRIRSTIITAKEIGQL